MLPLQVPAGALVFHLTAAAAAALKHSQYRAAHYLHIKLHIQWLRRLSQQVALQVGGVGLGVGRLRSLVRQLDNAQSACLSLQEPLGLTPYSFLLHTHIYTT